MIKESNKIKILSASAVALIALSGTAYGTGVLDDASENDSYTEADSVEQVQEQEVNETETGQEELTDEELEGLAETEEGQDKQEIEGEGDNQGGEEPKEPEGEQDDSGEQEVDKEDEQEEEQVGEQEEEQAGEQEGEQEGEQAGDQEDEQEDEQEEEQEHEEVDDTKVVPHEDLPIDEETGLLDFPEYHKIADGRALPRPLTEEEEEFFNDYVIEGQYNEIRTSVREVEYEYIYIYPEEFYREDNTLKYHKHVEILSELLTLEEQQDFLEYHEEYQKMSEEIGQEYNEETGEYEDSGENDSDYIVDEDVSMDDASNEPVNPADPSPNDNPKQDMYYETKPILEDLTEYDSMTEEEFKEAYGFNFLFRGVVEEGGFVQEEYELNDGLTLVVEAESLKTGNEGSEDTIVLRWGVVEEVVRYEGTIEGLYQEGQYNLVTNPKKEQDFVPSPSLVEEAKNSDEEEPYLGSNVVATGYETLREDGRYTPQRVVVEYATAEGVLQTYSMVADAVHVGDELPLYSDIVGFIEYGFELGWNEDDHGTEDDTGNEQDPDEDETGQDTQDPDVDEDGTGQDTQDPDADEDDTGQDSQDPEEDGEGSGTGVTDEYGDDSEDLGSGEFDSEGNLIGGTSEEEEEVSSEGTDTESGQSSERFQQTGANIIWGSILAGLGLGGLGTYLYKKSKKDNEEGDELDE